MNFSRSDVNLYRFSASVFQSENMKKISSLLLLLLCNIVCLQAQENRIVELEKSAIISCDSSVGISSPAYSCVINGGFMYIPLYAKAFK